MEGQTLESVVKVVEELTVRVEKLDQKVEERLYDTRPMWEQVIKNVQQIQEGQERMQEALQGVQEGLEHLRHDSRDLRTFLRDILRRMSIFNDTLVAIQADYRDIYDRVRGLELKAEVNGQCDLLSSPQ